MWLRSYTFIVFTVFYTFYYTQECASERSEEDYDEGRHRKRIKPIAPKARRQYKNNGYRPVSDFSSIEEYAVPNTSSSDSYYSESTEELYAEETIEHFPTLPTTPNLTDVETTTRPSRGGRTDKRDNYEENRGGLVDVAWNDYKDKDALQKEEYETNAEWYNFWWRLTTERWYRVHYDSSQPPINRACYRVAATYYNAMFDVREYYKLRYVYFHEFEYEVGYIVHEIVFHYSQVLEIYHDVQNRYNNFSRFREYAPAAFMFYVYTNLLHKCQQIMHLCNALSLLERRYKHVKPPFDFKVKPLHGNESDFPDFSKFAGEDAKEGDSKENRKKQKKKSRQRYWREMLASGRYTTDRRTRRPRSYGYFPHHYGWSIEYW